MLVRSGVLLKGLNAEEIKELLLAEILRPDVKTVNKDVSILLNRLATDLGLNGIIILQNILDQKPKGIAKDILQAIKNKIPAPSENKQIASLTTATNSFVSKELKLNTRSKVKSKVKPIKSTESNIFNHLITEEEESKFEEEKFPHISKLDATPLDLIATERKVPKITKIEIKPRPKLNIMQIENILGKFRDKNNIKMMSDDFKKVIDQIIFQLSITHLPPVKWEEVITKNLILIQEKSAWCCFRGRTTVGFNSDGFMQDADLTTQRSHRR